MRTGVIYARYSSERQTEQSIEGQIRECMTYAQYHDITIVDTYIDRAMSGTNDKRDEFQRMLKDAQKRPWDLVLVYKLDRFSRNKYEMAVHKKALRDNNISLISAKEHIPDGPEGIILESLLEGMAEYYSVELAQKIRRGQKETRIKGNYAGGGIPYGYKIENRKYVVSEDEAKVVIRIYEMYASGAYAKDIIQTFNEEGIKHRTGKSFTKAMIYGILQNERYIGIYHHKTEGVYTDMFPPIVPRNLFESVQAIVEINRHGKHPKDAGYLFRGKIRCGYCGQVIVGDSGTSQNGDTVRYYSCKKRKQSRSCEKKSIRKDVLETIVIDTTLKVLSNPANINLLVEKLFAAHEEKLADLSTLHLLEAERDKIQAALDNVMRAVEQGIFTATTKKRIEELEAELEVANSKVLVEQSKSKTQITPADIRKFIAKVLKKEPLPMIRTLINHIKIFNDHIEVYYNFIDRKGPDVLEHQVFSLYSEEIKIQPQLLGANYNARSVKITMEMFF